MGSSSLVLLAILSIADKLKTIGEWLMGLGMPGLFGISLLDSALVPLPGGPDLGVIVLSARNPGMMPAYALAAAAGSTIGCTVLYLLARRAGSVALRRVRPERRERIENLLGRYDMLAVAVPAVLPPPFPFKPFVLCAGVFKLKTARFVTAILIGRTCRFLIEGWLAVRFGEEAWPLIRRHGIAVVIGAVLVALVVFALKTRRKRLHREASATGSPPSN
jgi:membrane protein YqaA with SNARE-associated domain